MGGCGSLCPHRLRSLVEVDHQRSGMLPDLSEHIWQLL
jgi:hypothetical protein